MQAGLTAASQVLRNPDVFDGTDPHGFVSWKFIFTSWLTFAEPKFQQMLDKVEALDTLPAMSEYSEDEKQCSSKLFAILTSYLRGRCLHLVRSGMQIRDGFRLWKELHREYLPSTRARSLAIAQALATYPSFPKEKSVLESVLSFEQLVQEFEKLSGTTYPAELKAATLIRCSESRLREHLQLTVKEDATYAQIREALLSHEQVSKTWSQETIMKSLTLRNDVATNPSGPAPMEIDRIEKKGKGKGKYKGKYKGGRSWWQNIPFGSRGNPKGKGRGNGRGGKAKGKNKGKSFNKGKTKNKGKAGGKKGGQTDANQCRICFAYGHWSRDGPNRMVQQIENSHITPNVQQQLQQQQRQISGSTATAVMSMPYGSVGSNAPTLNTAVRRIFHIGPPSSLAESDVSTIRVIIQEVVDDSQAGDCRSNIILDSGSDVSLLPVSFSSDTLSNSAVRLQDCQGTSLSTVGQQHATLIVHDSMSGEEVELRRNFLVGNVRNCILSLGELYKSGWVVEQEHGRPMLCSPDRQVRAPVFFQRNSFAIEATVCRVTELGKVQDACEVRAVIRLSPCFVSDRRYGVWDVENNHPFMKSLRSALVDPRAVWSANFAFRTTLIQHVSEADEGWQVVELSQNYLEQEDPFGRIAEVPSGEQCIILTILADREETLASFGSLVGGEEMLAPEAELAVEETPESSGSKPGDDGMEIEGNPVEGHEEAEGEEVMGQDIPEFPILAPAFSTADREETLFIGEMRLTENSSVKQLREAAKYLRLSSSGSKSKIFNRIRDSYETSLKRRALEVARQDYAKLHPEPRFVDAPVQPSERERKLHEVTHLPFKRWCAFCVMGKSRANLKYASEPAEIASRSNPTVQVDIFFQTAGNCLLLCVDTWSKYVSVHPLRNRISGVIGEKIAEFLATLGHLDTVELAFDNEPVLAAGAKMTKLIRSNNGLHTILAAGKFYDKSRTSLAERTIQTVRAQGKTLLSHIEDRAKVSFGETSVLHSWALQVGCLTGTMCRAAPV